MGLPQLQPREVVTNDGLRTPYGLVLPPGANVAAYVRSTGVQSTDSAFVATNLVPTLALGLARARAGLGDFVVCLPGHTENVIDATTFSGALQAGTKIIGIGRGSNIPTFNFTLAGSSWLINKADVAIIGLKFNCAFAGNTTSAIAVSAADFGFYYNEVIASSASGGVNSFILTSAGADRMDITGNIARGVAGVASTVVNFQAANNDCRVCDNEMITGAPSATGLINFGASGCAGSKVLRNTLNNITVTSVAAIAYANVGHSGQCAYNNITVLSTGVQVAGTTGITVGGTSNLVGFFQNFVVNDPNKSGLIQPTVDT